MRSLLDEFFSVDNSEPTPLMEGEGRSFRVLGFNQSQRAIFVQTLMRYLLSNKAFRQQKLFCLNFTFFSLDASNIIPSLVLHRIYKFFRLAKKIAGMELAITIGRSLFLA